MSSPLKLSRSSHAARLNDFPDLLLNADSAFARRGRWCRALNQRTGGKFDGNLILEIGCFNADFLCRIAARHPSTGFVGIDWKCKPLIEAAERISAAGLRNVTLLRSRAQDLARIFGKSEVNEIWIFHPDPCDRKVELKNRLINEAFLADVHAVLKNDDSVLAIKTDHPGYYQWMLSLLGLPAPAWFDAPQDGGAHPRLRRKDLMHQSDLPPVSQAALQQFKVAINSADFWEDAPAQSGTRQRLFTGEQTLFESRFVRKRQPIHYLELRKQPPIT